MTKEEAYRETKREMTKVEIKDFDDFYQKVVQDVLKWAPKDPAFIEYLKSDATIDRAYQSYKIFENTSKETFGYFVNHCVTFTALKLYSAYDGAKEEIEAKRANKIMDNLYFRNCVEYPEEAKERYGME